MKVLDHVAAQGVLDHPIPGRPLPAFGSAGDRDDAGPGSGGADRTEAVSVAVDKIVGMKDPQVSVPEFPAHLAHLAGESELVAAWEHELVERRAQAAKVESLLGYKARKLEQNQRQHSFTRQAVEKGVTRDAAAVLGLTEAVVRRLIGTAEFLTEKLPKTWKSYQSGAIDRDRAAKAAVAVEDIAHRGDLLPVIDAEIVQKAPRQNAVSLEKWLSRRVAELDTLSFQQRYDRAQARRYVNFHHRGDGMTRIDALIPTLVAAQLEQEIYTQARNAPRTPPQAPAEASTAGGGDSAASPEVVSPGVVSQERTLTQRIADAFTDRLQAPSMAPPVSSDSAETPETSPGAPGQPALPAQPGLPAASGLSVQSGSRGLKIGVLVPVQTLTGDSDEPGFSWDRSWSLPAQTLRQIAADPTADHDWYLAGTTASAATSTATSAATTAANTAAGAAPGVTAGVGADHPIDPEHPKHPEHLGNSESPASPAGPSVPGVPGLPGVPASTGVRGRIVTVLHPRTGPGQQSLQDWIHSADPQAGNLLTRTYASRTSRDRQRDAILIRDGQCTEPGCSSPGWQAEIDHTQSYKTGGHTTGANLQILCRDCHSIKSHRIGNTRTPTDTPHPRAGPRAGPNAGPRAGPRAGCSPTTVAVADDSGARASPRPEPRHSPPASYVQDPLPGGVFDDAGTGAGAADDDDVPDWLIETRPPPDWAVDGAA